MTPCQGASTLRPAQWNSWFHPVVTLQWGPDHCRVHHTTFLIKRINSELNDIWSRMLNMKTYLFSGSVWRMKTVFQCACSHVAFQSCTPTPCSWFHSSTRFSLEKLQTTGRLRQPRRRSRTDTPTSDSHPHLSSVSCGTQKAADRAGSEPSRAAAAAPAARRWCIRVVPAPTAAQGRLLAYRSPLRTLGSSVALTASKFLAVRNTERPLDPPDRLHGAQLSNLLDQAGVVRQRFRSEGMRGLQCRSLSAENQLFQRPREETTSHSSSGILSHPRKRSVWVGILGDAPQPWITPSSTFLPVKDAWSKR